MPAGEQRQTVDLKTGVPHSARVYDHILGGKDNFPADRAAAAEITKSWPNLPTSMRANRNFMARVARVLAADHGIRQFLDIGTGLPTAPNLHEVAQEVAPESRILYVDNDPIVLLHARALLTSSPEGRTMYLDADFHDPEKILASEQLRETLDLGQPLAVSLIAIVHFIADDAVVKDLVQRIMSPLPSGSILALSTCTADSAPEEVRVGVAAYNANGIPLVARDLARVERLFDGLELIDPGVVLVNHWHADERAAVDDAHVHMYGGIARKR
ncbi:MULTISPECIES: SAM-dependent methyltransferase [unclassified Pseudofrankia]|uniref:SAM-dependent methyltransferase n=1 Tax=unclassified Pseudofrankia TaxID=2994372 RepID=UPI0008D937E6|nr:MULTISPECIES: SAM-dependent methyltransferase [unclassified Pseudofrankia]MDT3442524.1 SAM-dependent methyltransferase [Pseudofrankia sp. BMG5.37]OHV74745.1 methyltransferase [Pseudofrankia sp. BMG5.36]